MDDSSNDILVDKQPQDSSTLIEIVSKFESLLNEDQTVPQDILEELKEDFEIHLRRCRNDLSNDIDERNIKNAAEKLIKLCQMDINNKIGQSHPNLVSMIVTTTNPTLSYTQAKSETVIQKPSVQLEEFEEESLDHHHSNENDPNEPRLPIKEGGNFFQEKFFQNKDNMNLEGFKNFVLDRFPIRKWLPKYSIKNDLLGDVLAALTVGLMLVPQGMAYALLAHLPPIYGLYAGTIPMFMYTFFGTSSEMSVGPAAMVSLTIPSAIAGIAEDGSPEYIALCTFLSLVTGLTLTIAGLLRFGFVIENLFSTPILNGFTQGAAVLIVLSQLKHLLRVTIPSTALTLPEILYHAFSQFLHIHLWTFMCGILSIIIILVVRRISTRIPTALIMMGLTTVIVAVSGANEKIGLKIIGDIPAGFPSPHLIKASFLDMANTAAPAVIVGIIGFIEAISAGKHFAARKHYKLDTSQELIALGVSNIAGSIFQCYPIGASLARTAVNFQTGSRTPLNQTFASILVSLVLIALTRLFYYTPLFILAAIVMTGAMSLINLAEPSYLWKTKEKGDLVQLYVTMIGTMLLGPILGVIIAICLAVLEFVYRAATPYVYEEGRIPDTSTYKNIEVFQHCSTIPGVIIIRMDARLAFYNINHYRERLIEFEKRSDVPVHTIIFDAGGISYIDSTALHGLEEIVDDRISKKIRVYFADARGPVLSSLQYSGIEKNVGVDNFFNSVHHAVEHLIPIMQNERDEITNRNIESEGEKTSLTTSNESNNKLAAIFMKIPGVEKIYDTVDQNKVGWKGDDNVLLV